MSTINGLSAVIEIISSLEESNGHYLDGLGRRIQKMGKQLGDITISELILLIKDHHKYYNNITSDFNEPSIPDVKISTVNHAHRLNGYPTKNPGHSELLDVIHAMTDRADAVIAMIQMQFLGDADRLNDELIFNALDSVSHEIKDIKSVVNHFYKAQKSLFPSKAQASQ